MSETPTCPVLLTQRAPAMQECTLEKSKCPVSGKVGSGCPFAEIIKATAPAVAPKCRDIVDDFYPRMFKNDPVTKKFFNPANQFKEPPLQRLALANAVVAYASNIDQPENLIDAVKTIAHKHCGLGVLPEHYSIVHRNLCQSILHVLGEEVVTPEIGQGWSDAISELAKILYTAEAECYRVAAERAGGWTGVKDFKVTNIRHVTDECAEFSFKPVDGSGPIDFTPGQFLTLHLKTVDGATPRHYTITNAPGQDYLQCCAKKIPNGVVSNGLHDLKIDDVVGLAPPFGVFTMKDGPAVLISAGIGATPVKCFLESFPERVKMVVHIDKNEARHPFKKEMLAAPKTHFVYTETSGRPDPKALAEGVLKDYLSDCDFYMCGPALFLNDMSAALTSAGAKGVHVDVFGPQLSLAHT